MALNRSAAPQFEKVRCLVPEVRGTDSSAGVSVWRHCASLAQAADLSSGSVVHEWEYQGGAVWGFADRDPGFWSGDVGFETPEEAAAPEIPARFVRVVSVQYHPDGNHAVVELLTNEEPQLYPYTVFCE